MQKVSRSVAAALTVVAAITFTASPNVADAQNVFQKIGDGWRKGRWIHGLPDIKPKTWQEVVFPICWGRPQECREDAGKKVAPGQEGPLFQVGFVVNCIDRDTGRDRGDSTMYFRSKISMDDAKKKALAAYQTQDLCQADPNYHDESRVTVPGSGHFEDA
jgi:hypothetical protein